MAAGNTEAERSKLERLVRRRTISQQFAERACIVLECGRDGAKNRRGLEIAESHFCIVCAGGNVRGDHRVQPKVVAAFEITSLG